ncbi:MAG: O-antigen translocase [Bacteroidales bacterium]|nr:O-antigen translocase [Bacteroidales bacterium]
MSSAGARIEGSNSYKSIFKATTLFGGVQLYQVLVNIVRSKFVAVLLGTAGMGIQGMFMSTLQFIQSITSLGLSQSAVRDVSEANGTADEQRLGKTVSAFRKLVWFTGLLGMVAVMVFSPILSEVTFGNHDYTVPFILLSCILLIDQLASGQKVVLQGMRRLKELAKSSAIGATLGLLISVPIYYVFGIKGIVPTLILNSVTGFLISWFFARRISIPREELSAQEIWRHGGRMVKMGVAMSVSAIFSTAVSYIIRAFIMRHGGTESVGLYQAGFVVINTYVGMIFTAIGTDFYPRLAAVNQDNAACRSIVSRQGEIASQILAPLLCLCVLFMPLILRILYSNQFLSAAPFVLWCCPGMMLKMASWLVAYQFVAKAQTRLFVFTELSWGLIYLALSLAGYRIMGLAGLGIAFTVTYIIYLVLVLAIAVRKYGFSFSGSFVWSFLIQTALVAGALAAILLVKSLWRYWLGAALTVSSCTIALLILEKKTGVLRAVRERFVK